MHPKDLLLYRFFFFFLAVFIVVVLFSAFKICEVNILTCRYCSYLRWAERVYVSVHILTNYG